MHIISERRQQANGAIHPSRQMAIQIDDVKVYEKRTLRAFIDFTLVEIGLRINGAMIHEKDGKRWVGMPAREYMSEHERKWSPIIDFSTREVRAAVTDAVLAAYDEHLSAQSGGKK